MTRTEGKVPRVELLGPSALVGGTMLTALAVYVDAWWHVTFGRDTFWIPPHIAIYSGVSISIAGFLLIWRSQKTIPGELRIYLGGLVGVVVAGYGDQLWHQKFGVERIGTLASIWSPTHVAALVAGSVTATGVILYLRSMMKTTGGRAPGWLLAGEFAALVSILTLVLLPLGPETPFRVVGIAGAPLVAFVVLYLRFTGAVLSMRPGALSMITAFNWTGNIVILSTYASNKLVTLLLVAGISPAVLADMILYRSDRFRNKRGGYALAGLSWGLIFGSVFYPLTNGLLSSPLDTASLLVIAFGSSIAGLASGVLAWSHWGPLSSLADPAYVRVKQVILGP
ncbi:MAG TPA: hypothetical protein VFE96_08980 [Candidatus Bathyarchaeia archaeon]|jgi:hypothetical protein|nr:hypothetical protein [Candidatus Bathyarchaeia archaeon]